LRVGKKKKEKKKEEREKGREEREALHTITDCRGQTVSSECLDVQKYSHAL